MPLHNIYKEATYGMFFPYPKSYSTSEKQQNSLYATHYQFVIKSYFLVSLYCILLQKKHKKIAPKRRALKKVAYLQCTHSKRKDCSD